MSEAAFMIFAVAALIAAMARVANSLVLIYPPFKKNATKHAAPQ
jgi:hypothetical protein